MLEEGGGKEGNPSGLTASGGAARLESSPDFRRGYTQGYTQGISDATQNFAKLVEALRNPPPILVDASSIEPKFLASLMAQSSAARSAPNPSAGEGSPPSSSPPKHPHPGETP